MGYGALHQVHTGQASRQSAATTSSLVVVGQGERAAQINGGSIASNVRTLVWCNLESKSAGSSQTSLV